MPWYFLVSAAHAEQEAMARPLPPNEAGGGTWHDFSVRRGQNGKLRLAPGSGPGPGPGPPLPLTPTLTTALPLTTALIPPGALGLDVNQHNCICRISPGSAAAQELSK